MRLMEVIVAKLKNVGLINRSFYHLTIIVNAFSARRWLSPIFVSFLSLRYSLPWRLQWGYPVLVSVEFLFFGPHSCFSA